MEFKFQEYQGILGIRNLLALMRSFSSHPNILRAQSNPRIPVQIITELSSHPINRF